MHPLRFAAFSTVLRKGIPELRMELSDAVAAGQVLWSKEPGTGADITIPPGDRAMTNGCLITMTT